MWATGCFGVGGVWRARAEMGKLLRMYEGRKLSSSLFNVLLIAGCGDVALALARSSKAGPISPAQEAAMRAAAGDWQDALQTTLQAYRLSLAYPRYLCLWHTRWLHCSSLPMNVHSSQRVDSLADIAEAGSFNLSFNLTRHSTHACIQRCGLVADILSLRV